MTATPKTAEIVPIRPKERMQESEKKWGKKVIDLGFSIIPSVIFRAQARLGLSPVQLAVLLHLADYWWQKERMPYPSKATIAERLGLKPRQIQRYITELEDGGFISRNARFAGHKGQLSNEYDLSGLVEKLKKLEPEISSVEEQRKRVIKRGGLAVKAAPKKSKE
jgi:hypothetical protein